MTFHPHPLQVLAPNNAPLQIQTLNQKIATIESLGIPLVVVIPFDMQLAQMSARDFALQDPYGKSFARKRFMSGPISPSATGGREASTC